MVSYQHLFHFAFMFVCFQSLMTDETIANVPILIFGNKIDRPEAISEERLREMFGLYGQTTGKVKKKCLTSMKLHSTVYFYLLK